MHPYTRVELGPPTLRVKQATCAVWTTGLFCSFHEPENVESWLTLSFAKGRIAINFPSPAGRDKGENGQGLSIWIGEGVVYSSTCMPLSDAPKEQEGTRGQKETFSRSRNAIDTHGKNRIYGLIGFSMQVIVSQSVTTGGSVIPVWIREVR